jgi:hypothetical protein
MKHEIVICAKNGNCKSCAYVEFKSVRSRDSFSGQWMCRLFDIKLHTISGLIATLINENPHQCGECKLLIKRHLSTPEFQG